MWFSHRVFDICCFCSFEVLHARWAMLGALGALLPEVLDMVGAFHFVEPVWWRVGYSKLKVSIFYIILAIGTPFCSCLFYCFL